MHKLLTTTALACAVTMLTCCQLDDPDSAPRAPDATSASPPRPLSASSVSAPA